MDVAELKSKIVENKVPAASLFLALVACAVFYFRMDLVDAASSERLKADAELEVLKFNELNSRTLDVEIAEAKSLYDLVAARSLDFDSPIGSQAFFSDLLTGPLVFDGIPSLVAAPMAVTVSKAFATGVYVVQADGSSAAIIDFCKKAESGSVKSLHVERVQLSTAEKGATSASVAVRAWGRRGGLTAPQAAAVAGKIISKQDRQDRIKRFRDLLSSTIDISNIQHVLDSSHGSAAAGPSKLSGLDEALQSLKVYDAVFQGQRVARFDKIGIKRVGASFEMPVGAGSQKVTLVSISSEGVVLSVASKIHKIPFSK